MSQPLRNALLGLALAAFVLPLHADAQSRRIISKSVSASSSATSLELEFADRTAFEVRFEDGTVFVDDEPLGGYGPGGELDTAWREMLGEAMSLENGALAETLRDWSPPSSIAGEAADVGRTLAAAVENALAARPSASPGDAPPVSVTETNALVRTLLNSISRMGVLDGELIDMDGEVDIHVDEDVLIAAGETVEGTVVVIEGTLRVEGEVDGDVVVVGGALDIRESGVIRGEARVADARVLRNRGEVRGGIIDVLEAEREVDTEVRNRLREEIREEVRNDLRHELRSMTRLEDDDGFSIMSPLRPVVRGVGGVLEKLIIVFVLGLVGAGFLAFAGENMDAIAETARRAPGRSAMVGFAGTFLLVPVWILGAVALVVSIIGIPVAIAWVPLFPIAAALAAVLGYVAVARNAGEWLAESRFPWTGWIRKSNPIFTLFGGLLGLSFAFIAAHVISIAPFLGVFSGLLFAIGAILTFFAMQIGFGAVLLTRAGRRREYTSAFDPDVAWEAAMRVDVDDSDDKG